MKEISENGMTIWEAVVGQAVEDYRGLWGNCSRIAAVKFFFPDDAEGYDALKFICGLASVSPESLTSRLLQQEVA